MANFAVIQDGKVINAVVADEAYAAEQGWVALTGNAGIDWDYVNGEFIDNRPVPEVTPPVEPTKDELLAQLAELSARIQALE
jgi:hypothetical protein